MSKTNLVLVLLLIAVSAACAGCAGPAATAEPTAQQTSQPTAQPTAEPTAQPTIEPTSPTPAANVTISGSAFSPDTVTIPVHGSVTWTNEESLVHTVEFDGQQSGTMGRGEQYTRTFDTPGTYEYVCGIHPFMKGKVIVQ
ncbi:plastocyanin/azurin family copper-binding protein [Methanocella arvoryzae]|uniref:Predicted plastocyanin-like protein n=1 Tax=Methanocella arvoryzae (strain DSM 22066 / NBRC 105507 / MRE50) TaxID=351160 RepID=Q0W706_METAR|nr:plastocyanin/azurin family copper-binding protein [Methanocella arvoryzae]CAJ35837.1 predicted plastocyanin-like protein [Methanocella arvoryzae MRE50]